MRRKQLFFISIITLIAIVILYSNRKVVGYEINRKLNVISAGSYPYAEQYEINASETDVQSAIIKFKNSNPQFTVADLRDKIPGDAQDYNKVYFLLKESGHVIYTYTTSRNPQKTKFAFVSLSSTGGFGNWKAINEDFDYSENEKLLRNFENQILNPIKLLISK